MTKQLDNTTIRRLVHLYLLNIKIAEPYHRVISALFGLLDFDDSKDRRQTNKYSETVTKYNREWKEFCFIRVSESDNYVSFNGKIPYEFLDEVFLLFFENNDREILYDEVKDFLKPFLFCILEKKGIVVNRIYF